jgi:D-alanyl-lipoteichoic acid acyltransferase DltB (MBOAT superfamily)
MLFNSLEFLLFLPIVFTIFWVIPKGNVKAKNILFILASYVFYGWWDWRFLSLIVFSSFLDFFLGKFMGQSVNDKRRKFLLILSLIGNLGILMFFKYFNFFTDSFEDLLNVIGFKADFVTLNVILPVGISFYTFQTLSYTIDVYRKKIEPTNNILAFFAFVSFFPQLVAGPIERAKSLLPQFYTPRVFDYQKAVDGMRQILWGLFKKVVIADNCAGFVNDIFINYQDYSGSTLFLGGVLFAFQIYGDFSGYSDIAIGTARLFGVELMRNFAFPYFSRDIAEFWRRWHISLSTWFRDYVYIPLGGSRSGNWGRIRNTFIIFVVSGFWHGANWTFIFWGFLNALYFLPLMLLKQNRKNLDVVASGRFIPGLREFSQIMITFLITVIAWIFFRAENLTHAWDYLFHMFSSSLFSASDIATGELYYLIGFLVLVEWLQRDKQHALNFEGIKLLPPIRWTLYYGIIFMIFWFGGSQQDFIYFQF